MDTNEKTLILRGQTSRDTKARLEARFRPSPSPSEADSYWAYCVTHGVKSLAAGKSDAIKALGRPRGWCAECREMPPRN